MFVTKLGILVISTLFKNDVCQNYSFFKKYPLKYLAGNIKGYIFALAKRETVTNIPH
jgi:hypothetical protein